MESVPYEPGRKTNFETLYSSISGYCIDLGFEITKGDLESALADLHNDQCLVRFSNSDIRPTQYGLNKYLSWQ